VGDTGSTSTGVGDSNGGDVVGGVCWLGGESGESSGGEATPDRGERRSSPSPSGPRSSSTSLRRLLILLGGGVITSGDEGAILGGEGDTAWDGVAALFSAGAAVAVEGERTAFASTVVAARPRRRRRRRRRRRLLAVAAVVGVVGRLHVTVTTWRPAAWLNTTRAFKPLARQRSYNAEKSALETVGCGVGQAGISTLAHSPPLTTSAHVGDCSEVGGQGEA
jgi:hypothetical protein